MRKLLSLLLFLPTLAFADRTVTISTSVDAWWSAQTWINMAVSGSVSLLDSGGNVISTAPSASIGTITNVTATFPVVTQAVSVSKIRLALTQTGNNWTGVWVANYTLPTPLPLSVGEIPTITYNPTVSILSGATLTASIQTPVVTPPPPSGVSADCTKMPPATQLIDASGAVWTLLPLSGGVTGQTGAARNGVRVLNSVDFVTIKGGVVYDSDFGSGTGWERWTGSGFTASVNPGC